MNTPENTAAQTVGQQRLVRSEDLEARQKNCKTCNGFGVYDDKQSRKTIKCSCQPTMMEMDQAYGTNDQAHGARETK